MTNDREHEQSAHRDARSLVDAFPLGAHLVTSRRSYVHHGIYVGNGKVVHYAGFSSGIHRGPVAEVSLAEFADGRAIRVKPSAGGAFPPDQIAARARSRLGEDRYRLTTNNCEHFCEWCVHGESRSEQVDTVFSSPRRALAFVVALCGELIADRRAPQA